MKEIIGNNASCSVTCWIFRHEHEKSFHGYDAEFLHGWECFITFRILILHWFFCQLHCWYFEEAPMELVLTDLLLFPYESGCWKQIFYPWPSLPERNKAKKKIKGKIIGGPLIDNFKKGQIWCTSCSQFAFMVMTKSKNACKELPHMIPIQSPCKYLESLTQ